MPPNGFSEILSKTNRTTGISNFDSVQHTCSNALDVICTEKKQFQTNWNESQAAPFTKMLTLIYASISCNSNPEIRRENPKTIDN